MLAATGNNVVFQPLELRPKPVIIIRMTCDESCTRVKRSTSTPFKLHFLRPRNIFVEALLFQLSNSSRRDGLAPPHLPGAALAAGSATNLNRCASQLRASKEVLSHRPLLLEWDERSGRVQKYAFRTIHRCVPPCPDAAQLGGR
uniref:Uncharacterized protein n=1 Tax=Timema shepardi TaxID=629360 RepID=A0A7R9AQT6_TIMSH|nr:unnamed protein product [Timema shepardi]